MNYIKLIDKLVHELSFRVGIPNVKDKEHQSIMSEILSEWGNLDEKKIIMEFLTNEADGKKKFDGYTHIGAGSYVKDSQVDNDGKAKAGAQKYKSDGKSLTAMSDDEYDKIKGDQGEKGKEAAADSDQNQQGGEDDTQQTEEPAKGTALTGKGGDKYKDSLPDGDPAKPKKTDTDDTESKESKDSTPREGELNKLRELPKTESIKIDHQSADDSLAMTKKESKAQAKRTVDGEKQNVGAGTPESRAGEAMVHKGLRLIQEGKSLEEIEAGFNKLVNSDDHILNSKEGKKWVGSTIASIKKIDETIGLENIDIVSWDTDAGRTSIGVDPDLETSSDMFVRTKDGKNLGISLKKDGAVFLNNGGWNKQSKLLLGDLKSKMGEDSHKRLSEAMSIDAYESDVTDRFKFISNTITEDVIKDDIERFKTDKELYTKYFGGAKQPVYERILANPTVLYKKMAAGTLNKNEQKVIAKLTQIYHKVEYKHLRESENALSQRTFEVLNSNKDAKDGMNKHIIKSMHISETLSLNKRVKAGGVDGFQTMYGIEPDGAVLNEETLVTLFGSNFQSMLNEQIKEVRDGNQSYEELEQFIADSIEIDYESGQILFKHESNKKFPLFKLQGRARGIGAAPVMEMLQTPFMAHALKMGTFNTDEWDDASLKKYEKDIEEFGSDTVK